MNEQIDIWLVGNTGLRNPNRIQDGFKVLPVLHLQETFTAKTMKLGL